MTTIRKALLLRQSIVLHYQKPDADKPIAYPVDPYALLLYQNGLYLYGYSHRSKNLRMFAVERIHKVVPTNERFDIQPGFSFKEMNRHAFGLIEEAPQAVRIRFKRKSPTWSKNASGTRRRRSSNSKTVM